MFEDHLISTSLLWAGMPSTRAGCTVPSYLALNNSRNGLSTTSLGNLVQCLTILTVKIFFLEEKKKTFSRVEVDTFVVLRVVLSSLLKYMYAMFAFFLTFFKSIPFREMPEICHSFTGTCHCLFLPKFLSLLGKPCWSVCIRC